MKKACILAATSSWSLKFQMTSSSVLKVLTSRRWPERLLKTLISEDLGSTSGGSSIRPRSLSPVPGSKKKMIPPARNIFSMLGACIAAYLLN